MGLKNILKFYLKDFAEVHDLDIPGAFVVLFSLLAAFQVLFRGVTVFSKFAPSADFEPKRAEVKKFQPRTFLDFGENGRARFVSNIEQFAKASIRIHFRILETLPNRIKYDKGLYDQRQTAPLLLTTVIKSNIKNN